MYPCCLVPVQMKMNTYLSINLFIISVGHNHSLHLGALDWSIQSIKHQNVESHANPIKEAWSCSSATWLSNLKKYTGSCYLWLAALSQRMWETQYGPFQANDRGAGIKTRADTLTTDYNLRPDRLLEWNSALKTCLKGGIPSILGNTSMNGENKVLPIADQNR